MNNKEISLSKNRTVEPEQETRRAKREMQRITEGKERKPKALIK